MSDDSLILAKIREQNRLRQQKHYLAHKEDVNEKRRKVYQLGAEAIKPKPIEQPVEIPVITEHIAEAIADDKKIMDLSKSKTLTYNETNTYLKELNLNANTLTKYLSDFKRLTEITKCANILGRLKNPKKMISDIKKGKKKDGESYAINTQKRIRSDQSTSISRFK